MQYPDLAGRLVLLTGGANGIGEATVEAFCRQGADVRFCDIDVVVLAMDAPSSLTLRDRPFVPRCTSAATISIEPAALRNPNTTRRN